MSYIALAFEIRLDIFQFAFSGARSRTTNLHGTFPWCSFIFLFSMPVCCKFLVLFHETTYLLKPGLFLEIPAEKRPSNCRP